MSTLHGPVEHVEGGHDGDEEHSRQDPHPPAESELDFFLLYWVFRWVNETHRERERGGEREREGLLRAYAVLMCDDDDVRVLHADQYTHIISLHTHFVIAFFKCDREALCVCVWLTL